MPFEYYGYNFSLMEEPTYDWVDVFLLGLHILLVFIAIICVNLMTMPYVLALVVYHVGRFVHVVIIRIVWEIFLRDSCYRVKDYIVKKIYSACSLLFNGIISICHSIRQRIYSAFISPCNEIISRCSWVVQSISNTIKIPFWCFVKLLKVCIGYEIWVVILKSARRKIHPDTIQEGEADAGKEKGENDQLAIPLSALDPAPEEPGAKKEPIVYYEIDFYTLHKKDQRRKKLEQIKQKAHARKAKNGTSEVTCQAEKTADKITYKLKPEAKQTPLHQMAFNGILRPTQDTGFPPRFGTQPARLLPVSPVLPTISSDSVTSLNKYDLSETYLSFMSSVWSSLSNSAFDGDVSDNIRSNKSSSSKGSKTNLLPATKVPQNQQPQWQVKLSSDTELSYVKMAQKDKQRGFQLCIMETQSDLPGGHNLTQAYQSSSSNVSGGGYGCVTGLDRSSSNRLGLTSRQIYACRMPRYCSDGRQGSAGSVNTAWEQLFGVRPMAQTIDLNDSIDQVIFAHGSSIGLTTDTTTTDHMSSSVQDPFEHTINLNSTSEGSREGEIDIDGSLVEGRYDDYKETTTTLHHENAYELNTTDSVDGESEDENPLPKTDEEIIAASPILTAYFQSISLSNTPLYMRCYIQMHSREPPGYCAPPRMVYNGQEEDVGGKYPDLD